MSGIAVRVLEKLRTFDTPTICNTIELFQVRPRNSGFMGARIRACFPEMKPMVGFAATATFRAAGPPRPGDSSRSLADQVERFAELDGPAVVVFQDLDDPPVAATFGEMMCTTYKAYGAVGLVTSGAGRDLEQVRALGFPVFTSGAICAHGYCHIPDLHVPVRIDGVVVYPNDLLHGDLNGVTTIPRDIAADVADVASELIAAEAVLLDALRGEPPSVQRLREIEAESDECIARLAARVRRRRG
jgi:regulator of RNase E activity RraA